MIDKYKIGVLGSSGFIGSNLIEELSQNNICFVGGSRSEIGDKKVDARCLDQVINWINKNKITHIINLAAQCGGIGINQQAPADMWSSTTLINYSVLEASRICNIKKLVMIGTVCSYAENCPVPFSESDLMHHGFPEKTNSSYGVAKLNGLFGSKAYRNQYGLNVIYLMLVNSYGKYDNFNESTSHVIPAIIKKCIMAKKNKSDLICWGDGTATREFLHAKDAAKAIIMAMDQYDSPEPINIGSGEEISICDLVHKIANILEFKGKIKWDTTKPNGQLRRCLNIDKLKNIGFSPKMNINDGLVETINWYNLIAND